MLGTPWNEEPQHETQTSQDNYKLHLPGVHSRTPFSVQRKARQESVLTWG